MVRKIGVGMFTLLVFIYSNSKFKVTWKNVNFECQYIRTHSEENPSNISDIVFATLPVSHQNTLRGHNWVHSARRP